MADELLDEARTIITEQVADSALTTGEIATSVSKSLTIQASTRFH